MCARGGLTLTGWHGQELAEAQHSLPILMRHCEGLSSGLQRGPLGVRCSRRGAMEERGGSPWQQDEMGWRVSVHVAGWQMVKQPQRTDGVTWNVFKVTHRKLHHRQELFPATPAGPSCQEITYQWQCGCPGDMLGRYWKYFLYYSRWCINRNLLLLRKKWWQWTRHVSTCFLACFAFAHT